jgi:purine nucleoside phosphorylase
MTGMPEAGLARELGIDYASVCVAVNHAAGRGDSLAQVSMQAIADVLENAMDRVRALIQHIVPLVPLTARETPLARQDAVVMGVSRDDS